MGQQRGSLLLTPLLVNTKEGAYYAITRICVIMPLLNLVFTLIPGWHELHNCVCGSQRSCNIILVCVLPLDTLKCYRNVSFIY